MKTVPITVSIQCYEKTYCNPLVDRLKKVTQQENIIIIIFLCDINACQDTESGVGGNIDRITLRYS